MYDSLKIFKQVPPVSILLLVVAGALVGAFVGALANAVGATESAGSEWHSPLRPSKYDVAIESASRSQDGVREWVQRFYLQRPLCGNSEVGDVAIYRSELVVRLDIDPTWEASLDKLDDTAAGHWFAVHCPLPVASAESVLGPRDIRIVSSSENSPHTSFSCRDFERLLSHRGSFRAPAVRAAVTAVLQRLGALPL